MTTPSSARQGKSHKEKNSHCWSFSLPRSVSCIPAVEWVECLCWNTVKKFPGEDTKQGPCQIKWLEDVPGVIRPLCHKLLLEFVKELKVQLHDNACGMELVMSISYHKTLDIYRYGPGLLRKELLLQPQLSLPGHPYQWHSLHIAENIQY